MQKLGLTEHLYPRMVHEYYATRLRELEAARDARLAALRTAEDARAYCADVRKKIQACFGPRPEPTPLNVRVTGTIDRPTYTVDKLLYESRPNYFVTANLYRPKRSGPLPAVMGLCGHSENGKAFPNYAQYCRTLAQLGYIVLMPDPVSQGERYQYDDADKTWTRRDPCSEHNLAGNQMSLVGDFFGMWRAWDAIRTLDVLLAQPDVDKKRVGITGNSGGGTLSSYVIALDDRHIMSAISCFITTYRSNFDNELPADSEQCPPGILAAGLDMGDFLLAQAPKPTLLLGQKYDFFDVRGLNKTYEQVRRVYELLGAGDSVHVHIGPGPHGYHTENRQAMYRFFNATAGVSTPPVEATDEPLTEDQHQVTPTGRVIDLPTNRRVYEFTADTARALSRSRPKLEGAALTEAIKKVLTLPERAGVPHYRKLRQRGGDYSKPYQRVQTFGVETEPNNPFVNAILHAWHPVGAPLDVIEAIPAPPAATVCVPHISSRLDLTNHVLPAGEGEMVFSVDARGIGMSQALTANAVDFFERYAGDYFYASHGQMLRESYVGRRVHDVLCALDLLASNGTRDIHLIGRGLGGILAAFAAALHPAVTRVTLQNTPASFESLATASSTYWPLSIFPRGILQTFDLPDVYRMLQSKHLKLIEPWNARMQPIA